MNEPIADKNMLYANIDDFAKAYGITYTTKIIVEWVKMRMDDRIDAESENEEFRV